MLTSPRKDDSCCCSRRTFTTTRAPAQSPSHTIDDGLASDLSLLIFKVKKLIQMLEAARDDVRDEEFLFGDVELSERERKEKECKKTVYELANKRVSPSPTRPAT